MGTPLHLGVMPGVIRAILASYPVAQMQPGDVYGTNLPYPEGPGHLPDLSLVSPIFHDEQPIALAASTAHHVDMGATHPAACRALPDGTYQFENCLDDDGVTDEPVKIAVAIRVAGDELTADFAGSSRQVLGPLNARISAAQAAVYYTCKAVIDPDLPTCAGSYRPIHVHAPEGSILQASYPAAIGQANILTDQRVLDVLVGALAQCVPERVCAACSGEMNLINIGGIDSRPARPRGSTTTTWRPMPGARVPPATWTATTACTPT